MAGTCCNFATQLKYTFGYDDTLDIWASHSIGDVLRNVLTALFTEVSTSGFDGISVIDEGWIDHHYIQSRYQLADSVSGVRYIFVMTTIILWIMHFIPGCQLRGSEEVEVSGLDNHDMGEFSYDYIGLEQDVGGDGDAFSSMAGGREPRHLSHHCGSDKGSLVEKNVMVHAVPAY